MRGLYSRKGLGSALRIVQTDTLLSFDLTPRCWLHRDVLREDRGQGQKYHRFCDDSRIYWHYVAAEFLNSQTLFLLFVYVVFHQKL